LVHITCGILSKRDKEYNKQNPGQQKRKRVKQLDHIIRQVQQETNFFHHKDVELRPIKGQNGKCPWEGNRSLFSGGEWCKNLPNWHAPEHHIHTCKLYGSMVNVSNQTNESKLFSFKQSIKTTNYRNLAE